MRFLVTFKPEYRKRVSELCGGVGFPGDFGEGESDENALGVDNIVGVCTTEKPLRGDIEVDFEEFGRQIYPREELIITIDTTRD